MANHHYVPQFYFRNFSLDGRRICAYMPAKDLYVAGAAIRKQCAKQNFYGNSAIEAQFSILEGEFRTSIEAFRRFGRREDNAPSEETVVSLYRALLFQRARTALEARKESEAASQFALQAFRQHLLSLPNLKDRERYIQAIDQGNVTIQKDLTASVLEGIEIAVHFGPLILDLEWCLLVNRTRHDFVFSDAPVVFCNSYYRRFTERGVIGLATPGLQIFMPLDAKTTLMLFDAAVYRGAATDRYIVDLVEMSDVSRLNALQLLHHDTAVYFGDEHESSYVRDLWLAHRKRYSRPRMANESRDGWLVDDQPVEGLRIQLERQPNVDLALSFVECDPVAPEDYVPRKRAPDLYEKCQVEMKSFIERVRSGWTPE